MPKIVISLLYILTFLNYYELVNIECSYGMLGLWAVGNKYRCSVNNHLFIDSPEKAHIDGVSGTHMNGKSNNDEIYFHIRSKAVQYLPRGLDQFFTNVTGIAVWYDLLKEIHQSDFKPFKNLECVNIFDSKIEILEENIFDFNPNLVAVSLGKANIFHIGSTLFDHLNKLTSLHLGGNKCINEFKENNRAGVEQIIRNLKLSCVSSEFLNFEKKLKILKNAENLTENLANFKLEFIVSKFANFYPLNEKFLKLKETKNDGFGITEKPIADSTTSRAFNCSESQNWTEPIQNHTKFDDLHIQNHENLKVLRNLTDDIKTSQISFFSRLDQKPSNCSNQCLTGNSTFNENFVQLVSKLTTFGNKIKKLELTMEEFNQKLNISKIEEIEKRITDKIETFLQDKFEKLLHDLKNITHF